MTNFVHSGKDIKTATDMKHAIESYGGIRGTKSCVCSVNEHINSKNVVWKGISTFHNFEFSRAGITAWQAYDIGPGKLFSNQWLNSLFPGFKAEIEMNVHLEFPSCNDTVGQMKGKQPHTPRESATADEQWCCPECSEVFLTEEGLNMHLDVGNHKSLGTMDKIRKLWGTI
jgi:hypothetical protein